MEVITHLSIAPADKSSVTPLELLRDFADSSPAWHYMEHLSSAYADERKTPACVLRHHRHGNESAEANLVFSAEDENELGSFTLRLVTSATYEEDLDPGQRQEAVSHFTEAFRGYLAVRSSHAEVKVERQEMEE